MVSIYSLFPKSTIEVNDDYSGPTQLHRLENILFQFGRCQEMNFLTNIGIKDNKIQSILGKQFYYVPEKFGGGSGVLYSKDLFDVYTNIKSAEESAVEHIEDSVFYCIDYETGNGTGHMYDTFFYLLYFYKKNSLSCPFLIPDIQHHFFNSLCNLLTEYYGIRFIRCKANTTYKLKEVYCVRTYLNIFFPEVKEFINSTLIKQVLEKYKGLNSYDMIMRLKIQSTQDVVRKSSLFPSSDRIQGIRENNSILLIDENMPEDLKIFYINTAKNIVVCWGSIYYIYIDYYLASTYGKKIIVLFHKDMMPERPSLISIGSRHFQRMNHAPSHISQVYNTLFFEGEIIDNLETLDSFLEDILRKCP